MMHLQSPPPALTEIENGKMLPDAYTLVLITNRPEKSIDYFTSEMYRKVQPLEEGELSNREKEPITQFRGIWDRDTKELIRQVKAAAELPTD